MNRLYLHQKIREKIIKTNKKLYGSNTPAQSNDIRNYIITKDKNHIEYIGDNFSLSKCDLGKSHNFDIKGDNYHGRIKGNIPLCTVCNPISSTSSIKEKELYNFIRSVYSGKIKRSYKDNRKEIDIFLEDIKLGFEFNGLYWHSEEYKDKNYHLNKTKYFRDKGIRIIHIWEDDWINKRKIIESQIMNWLGLTKNKIYARKCNVREISDVNIVRNFLNANHVQGFTTSTKKIGLYYNKELVSIMLFDKNEGRKKMDKDQWNLSRFSNTLDTSVIGGASKLLKYFIKCYDPIRIISYADRDWSEGNIYHNLGFSEVKKSLPDYKYIFENERVHKSKFRKSKIDSDLSEREYTNRNGIKRIWDCGKIKFEMKIT
jgi:hypothetical protein